MWYSYEMDDSGHCAMAAALRELNGMVVLSGYANPLYDELLVDWKRVERRALADGAKDRTEVLWFNDAAAWKARAQGTLDFAGNQD
jgi:DNA adenine methylase